MRLPERFSFSQSSLQDYVDCPRRFQLRYVQRVRWPAARDEPLADWERSARRGAAFHRLLQQHCEGVPEGALASMAREAAIAPWWQAYLSAPPRGLPVAERRAEVRLTAPLCAHRLVARYDLVATRPGEQIVAVDWKTNARRPKRAWLERRMQTLVYPYVLVEAGASIFGGPVPASAVELVFWFANSPAEPICFGYGAQEHAAAAESLVRLVREVAAVDADPWPLVADTVPCSFCEYRALCGRQDAPRSGDAEELEDAAEDAAVDLELEQIAEIAF